MNTTPKDTLLSVAHRSRLRRAVPVLPLACALLGGILPTSSALAQTTEARQGSGVITGRVSNGGTGQYLLNAVIVVEGTNLEARTAPDGYYRISGLNPGSYNLTVTFTGLNPETRKVVISEGKDELADFELGSEVYILGEFIVSSEREGSAKAIQEKRESNSMKNIVAADSFGNMVDGNIGELMKNLPGITVDYDGEDASAMRFRGMDPSLASVTMDGNPVATSPGTDTRSFALRDFPVQNIETIEINLATTPDKPANSMGGGINFVTKSAFSQKGRRIRLDSNLSINTAEIEFQKTPGGARTPDRKLMPGFTLSYSEAFGTVRPIGVSLTASFAQRYRFNNSYTLPSGYIWYQSDLEANGGVATPEMQGLVNSVLWTERGQANERRFLSLNLDYKLSDSTSLYINNSVSHDRGLGDYSHSVRVTAGTPQPVGATFERMISPAGASFGMGSSVSNNNTKTFSVNPGVKHRFGDLQITYDAFLSRSEYDPDRDRNYSIGYGLGGLGLTIDGMSGNATGVLTQTAGPDYKNIANYRSLSLTQDYTFGTDEQRGAKLDVKKPFSFWGVPVEIQAGVRFNEQTRDLQRYYRKWDLTGNSNSSLYGTAAEPNLQQFADPYFGNQWNFDVPIPNWISPYLVYDYFTTRPDQFYTNYIDGITASYSRERYGDRDSKEQIYAGYAMATAKLRSNLVLLAGARYEQTKLMATGIKYDATSNIFGVGRKFDTVTPGSPYFGITDPYVLNALLYEPVVGRKSYDKIFPNVQLKYEPFKNLVFRAAFTTDMGRPDLGTILPSDTEYYHFNLIRRNNTKLMPQEGKNYDLSVEYYLPRSGLLSLNLFRKDIKNYIYTVVFSEVRFNEVSGFDEDWTVETRENAGKGQNEGFEVEYKQKLGFITHYLRDLEFRAVFSAADPQFQYLRRTGTPVYEDPPPPTDPAYPAYKARVDAYMNSPQVWDSAPLPNIVEKSANVRLTYNGRKFSASVAAFWRDDFLRNPSLTLKAHTYQASDLRVDLNLTYKMSSHWSAYFDWRNATDVADERSIFNRTGGYYTSGMVMNVGIRANF
jgi:iron complex outermembrane receptor protein